MYCDLIVKTCLFDLNKTLWATQKWRRVYHTRYIQAAAQSMDNPALFFSLPLQMSITCRLLIYRNSCHHSCQLEVRMPVWSPGCHDWAQHTWCERCRCRASGWHNCPLTSTVCTKSTLSTRAKADKLLIRDELQPQNSSLAPSLLHSSGTLGPGAVIQPIGDSLTETLWDTMVSSAWSKYLHEHMALPASSSSLSTVLTCPHQLTPVWIVFREAFQTFLSFAGNLFLHPNLSWRWPRKWHVILGCKELPMAKHSPSSLWH